MKQLLLLATVLIGAAAIAQPDSPDTSCAADAVAAREMKAAANNFRAQYWLGTELELGRCGKRDIHRSHEMLRNSAAGLFPPAVHVLGVILRREGMPKDALVQFERAADLGFQSGFVDMGFTYGASELSVHDPSKAFAWLSVALDREVNPRLKAYLDNSLRARAESMQEADLAKAKELAEELRARFSAVPRWADKQ